ADVLGPVVLAGAERGREEAFVPACILIEPHEEVPGGSGLGSGDEVRPRAGRVRVQRVNRHRDHGLRGVPRVSGRSNGRGAVERRRVVLVEPYGYVVRPTGVSS